MAEKKITDEEYFATGVIDTNLDGLKKVYKGKVRDVYEVDEKTSLFVVTDRISSYDRVMKTPVPGKGKILNQISEFWFNFLEEKTGIKNHMITCDIDKMPKEIQKHKKILKGRAMLVRKLKMIPVEAICRAYLTGSGFKDYKKTGEVCGHKLKEGIQNCGKLEKIIFTPSTKAEYGVHDENITEEKAEELMKKQGFEYKDMKKAALALFEVAIKHAEANGIILADTKFEMGMLEGVLFVGDEVLTPDSSRYWDKKTYTPGRAQDSLDKQYVRDYLTSINFDRNGGGVPLPRQVTEKTMEKYITIFKILTGKEPVL
uniref:phosphoribosylaminoimidazolesuccinocarboxamide synthase n=1 Tax=Amorphochlora amoebiformis TaxID=1561963 RepID=A0A7S0CZF7_9EUKA|mmetsp:Transcript_16375/g.25941  ORF Transcript_16375/g.25941 Transcript_16375/m.25941 type:complete len:315 (+) Transcript_16375:99-1043(+)|eukprot:1320837-Amorphochlora_amoeboformis.AAC.2